MFISDTKSKTPKKKKKEENTSGEEKSEIKTFTTKKPKVKKVSIEPSTSKVAEDKKESVSEGEKDEKIAAVKPVKKSKSKKVPEPGVFAPSEKKERKKKAGKKDESNKPATVKPSFSAVRKPFKPVTISQKNENEKVEEKSEKSEAVKNKAEEDMVGKDTDMFTKDMKGQTKQENNESDTNDNMKEKTKPESNIENSKPAKPKFSAPKGKAKPKFTAPKVSADVLKESNDVKLNSEKRKGEKLSAKGKKGKENTDDSEPLTKKQKQDKEDTKSTENNIESDNEMALDLTVKRNKTEAIGEENCEEMPDGDKEKLAKQKSTVQPDAGKSNSKDDQQVPSPVPSLPRSDGGGDSQSQKHKESIEGGIDEEDPLMKPEGKRGGSSSIPAVPVESDGESDFSFDDD